MILVQGTPYIIFNVTLLLYYYEKVSIGVYVPCITLLLILFAYFLHHDPYLLLHFRKWYLYLLLLFFDTTSQWHVHGFIVAILCSTYCTSCISSTTGMFTQIQGSRYTNSCAVTPIRKLLVVTQSTVMPCCQRVQIKLSMVQLIS